MIFHHGGPPHQRTLRHLEYGTISADGRGTVRRSMLSSFRKRHCGDGGCRQPVKITRVEAGCDGCRRRPRRALGSAARRAPARLVHADSRLRCPQLATTPASEHGTRPRLRRSIGAFTRRRPAGGRALRPVGCSAGRSDFLHAGLSTFDSSALAAEDRAGSASPVVNSTGACGRRLPSLRWRKNQPLRRRGRRRPGSGIRRQKALCRTV